MDESNYTNAEPQRSLASVLKPYEEEIARLAAEVEHWRNEYIDTSAAEGRLRAALRFYADHETYGKTKYDIELKRSLWVKPILEDNGDIARRAMEGSNTSL